MRYRRTGVGLLAVIAGIGISSAQPSATVGNLAAFAKAYGYVRFFHPSDEAAAVDWNALAVHGAREVVRADTPGELRAALEAIFLPIAPTLRVYESAGAVPARPPELSPADASQLDLVYWQHLGVGPGVPNSVYRSVRVNRPMPVTPAPFAALTQAVDAADHRGRQLRLTGLGRIEGPAARVQLWMRVDLEGGGRGFFDNMADRPVRTAEWTEMSVSGPVAMNASRIVFGAIFAGGAGAVDRLRLEVQEADGWMPVSIVNGDFESGDPGPPGGWASASPGWSYEVTPDDAAPGGARSLRVSPAAGAGPVARPLFESSPEAGELIRTAIGRGLSIQLPLALASRDGHTAGVPDETLAAALSNALAAVRSGPGTMDDSPVRCADVIVAWNVFQHFYPYFDVVGTDWDQVLNEALRRCLASGSADDHRSTLEWLVSELHDGHGTVVVGQVGRARLPLRLEWIEGRVVVVATGVPDQVQVGDVVEQLDGVPASERLEAEAGRFSGTERWRRWRALGGLGAGAENSPSTLELRRGDARLTATVTRTTAPAPPDPRPEPIAQIEPGIFYVDLSRISMEDFDRSAPELSAAAGVVFDLRGYPNGTHLALSHLADGPLQSAFWRVPRIIRPDQAGELTYAESRWNLPPRQPRFRGRFAFLTDGRAISYAESVLGIVEHYELGEIVGEATAGANGNVNTMPLPSGARISFTGMRVIKHDGSQHHLVGIQPTVPMSRTIVGVRAGRDELLEQGLAIVRSGTGGGRSLSPGDIRKRR